MTAEELVVRDDAQDRHIAEPAGPSVSPRLEAAVAALCLAGMTAITFANVVVRYLTDASLAFTEEFAVFLMVAMTLFGASAAAARNGHIRTAIVVDRLPARLRRAVAAGAALASVATFAVLAVLGALYTYDIWLYEDVSPGLGWPLWWYWLWVPLMSAVIALRFLGLGLRVWRSGKEARP